MEIVNLLEGDIEDHDAISVVEEFSKLLGGIEPAWHIKNRPDGGYILFEFSYLHRRFIELAKKVSDSLSDDNAYKGRVLAVERVRRPENIFQSPEMKMLQRELSSSLTINRATFGSDFLSRYTPSVAGHEQTIIGNANFIVYGRRGAGKSSLLLYAKHKLDLMGLSSIWLPCQTYSGSNEPQVIAAAVAEILRNFNRIIFSPDVEEICKKIDDLASSDEEPDVVVKKIKRIIPRVRSSIGSLISSSKPLTIFLDDAHVINEDLQPLMLDVIYSLARDNNIYLKISCIEQLTNTWNATRNFGMQIPHDLQVMNLDSNLTMPEQSLGLISSILDGHARFCGLNSIKAVAEKKAIDRLIISAAAVPRDCLSLFSQAIAKSIIKGQKSVTISAINSAASESIEQKVKDFERDTSRDRENLVILLDKIKQFCIYEKKINAFLVKIQNNNANFKLMQKLIALRFVHLLHEGITPSNAGERYVALMLDFGFYVGFRAARSVELFLEEPVNKSAKDYRSLPILTA